MCNLRTKPWKKKRWICNTPTSSPAAPGFDTSPFPAGVAGLSQSRDSAPADAGPGRGLAAGLPPEKGLTSWAPAPLLQAAFLQAGKAGSFLGNRSFSRVRAREESRDQGDQPVPSLLIPVMRRTDPGKEKST